jgi:thiol-disulfide isomerase/thioredoxin
MAMRLGTPLPELDGASQWLGPPVTRAELVGAPVLVHFWAVSCYICKNNMPQINALHQKYGPKGLRVVAVHMPRQEEDMDLGAIVRVRDELKMEGPCALDNEHALKEAFQNIEGWVPAYFLFDQSGILKSRVAGEAGVSIIETTLGRLLDAAE